jgi:hypothetical protein
MTDDEDEVEINEDVQHIYDAMLDIFKDKQTADVLQALEGVISTILCNACVSKEAAFTGLFLIMKGVSSVIEEADKDEACSWNQRKH